MYITAVDLSDQHIAKMKVFMENKTRIKQPIYKIHATKNLIVLVLAMKIIYYYQRRSFLENPRQYIHIAQVYMFQESCALYILPQSKLVIMFSTTMINSNTLSHSVTHSIPPVAQPLWRTLSLNLTIFLDVFSIIAGRSRGILFCLAQILFFAIFIPP